MVNINKDVHARVIRHDSAHINRLKMMTGSLPQYPAITIYDSHVIRAAAGKGQPKIFRLLTPPHNPHTIQMPTTLIDLL